MNKSDVTQISIKPLSVNEPSEKELGEVALVLLPFLLPQKRSKANQEEFVQFVSEDKDINVHAASLKSIFPVIVVKGGFEGILSSSIVADKQVLFEVEGGMLEATMLLFATYYVFMFEYPSTLNNFSTYLHKRIFNIPDSRKLPTSVICFVNELESKDD
ncbi:uncharacterized protein LOC114538579 [Dendronephthya gigantea]|uniref:uncharacterized protein LOC114538579 n=1 Tax=Dendronephthya gigantea TaxID=151771 RepID=UPI00106C4E3B|nr:uncharacterized protein LOC114538579 [Dendronephthya gigantea]